MDSCAVGPSYQAAETADCGARLGRAGLPAVRGIISRIERRRFRRAALQARVFVSLPTSRVPVEANILDISAGDVRLICSEPLAVGEEARLVFQITSRDEVQTEEVCGRVFRSQMDDDVWVVEFELTEALDRRDTPLLEQAAVTRDTQS
jgi:PilZ domain